MKKYRTSISLVWSEKNIRKLLDDGEAYPSDNEIEELMTEEFKELIFEMDLPDILFEIIEDDEVKSLVIKSREQ